MFITDPQVGRQVRYDYDPQGRISAVTDPAGGVTRYTYDSNHRILSITDPRGITFITNQVRCQRPGDPPDPGGRRGPRVPWSWG